MPHNTRTVRRLRFQFLEDADNDFQEMKFLSRVASLRGDNVVFEK
jgi:hypothetical protein